MSVRCHARGQGSIPGGADKIVLVFDLIKALSSTMRSLDCELDVKIILPFAYVYTYKHTCMHKYM